GVTTLYVTHDQIEAMTLADRVVVMSRAEIQQIGSPEVIYNEPANLFVAGFIGSPSMNLIAGDLRDGVFEAASTRIAGFGRISRSAVVLGVRAEDMRVTEAALGQLQAPVFSCELTGDSTLVMVRIADQVVTARASKDYRARIGEPVGLAVDAARCHLFDSQTQNRLRLDIP
ncbi:MAG: TOBE domain-containing protein, partial [Rhodoferax sp.]|nr:TOBE domain-containing protein [Rhodoferax sp.]